MKAHSPNSHSKIFIIESYPDFIEDEVSIDGANIEYLKLNSEALFDDQNLKSNYLESLEDNIKISAGYLYKLSLDINNFYNSVYTHSITWAVCGKDKAKNIAMNGSFVVDDAIRQEYDKINLFDSLIRSMKNNETNGLIIGPFTSRIFSEIIVANIDKELREQGILFRRYVDDYSIYLRNEIEIDNTIKLIERTLDKFNLYINQSKTKKESFPYNIVSDIRNDFKDKENTDGIYGILNYALKLHSLGEKGAIRYALKMVKNKEIKNISHIDIVFSILINLIFSMPRHGIYVLDILAKNKSWIYKVNPERIINREISKCVSESKEHETIIYLELLRKLDLKLDFHNFELIVSSKNDLAIIVVLFFYKMKDNYLYGSDNEKDLVIEQLLEELKNEDYLGKRWLLLYEIRLNNQIKYANDFFEFTKTNYKVNNLLNRLYKHKVSFYKPDLY